MRRAIQRSAIAAVGLAALAIVPAATHAQQHAGSIRIENAWSRPTVADRPGVVYLTIVDTGSPDVLTGASTPIAAQAELHQSSSEGGAMTMRHVSELPVAPGAPVVLAPGGYHLMLMGLKHPLQAGETFPLTLSFAHTPPVTTSVTVRPLGPGAGAPMHH